MFHRFDDRRASMRCHLGMRTRRIRASFQNNMSPTENSPSSTLAPLSADFFIRSFDTVVFSWILRHNHVNLSITEGTESCLSNNGVLSTSNVVGSKGSSVTAEAGNRGSRPKTTRYGLAPVVVCSALLYARLNAVRCLSHSWIRSRAKIFRP